MAIELRQQLRLAQQLIMTVTIKSHNNAPLNPKAQFPLTIRDFMNTRVEKCAKGGSPCPNGRMKRIFSGTFR